MCYDVLLRARFVPPELDSHAQGLTAGACDTLAAGWMTTWAFVRCVITLSHLQSRTPLAALQTLAVKEMHYQDTLKPGTLHVYLYSPVALRGALAPLNERSGGQVYAAVDQMGAFFGTVLSCALALVSAVWARRGLIAAPAARLLVATAEQVRRHLEPFRVDTGLGA